MPCVPEPRSRSCAATVLIVDDDPFVLRVTETILKQSGFEVLTATNGDQALRVVEAQGGRIDLVLSDVCMPHMAGTELIRRIREIAPLTCLVLMSGEVGPEVLEPEVSFVQKPFSAGALVGAIRDLLGLRAQDACQV